MVRAYDPQVTWRAHGPSAPWNAIEALSGPNRVRRIGCLGALPLPTNECEGSKPSNGQWSLWRIAIEQSSFVFILAYPQTSPGLSNLRVLSRWRQL